MCVACLCVRVSHKGLSNPAIAILYMSPNALTRRTILELPSFFDDMLISCGVNSV